MPLKTSVLFLLLLSLIAQAKVSEAKRAYLDGQFDKAQLLFRHAANQELGSKRYRLRFAEAAAAYRQKKFNQAAKAYAESLRADDPQFRKQAHYNLANTLTREGQQQLEQSESPEKRNSLAPKVLAKWEDALSHYDDALQLQAKDKLTQENRSHLEKLIEELKKEQEQNQEENKDENQNQEQQDQQKNDQEDGEDQQDQENAENQEQGDDQEEQSSQNQEPNQPSQENQNEGQKGDESQQGKPEGEDEESNPGQKQNEQDQQAGENQQDKENSKNPEQGDRQEEQNAQNQESDQQNAQEGEGSNSDSQNSPSSNQPSPKQQPPTSALSQRRESESPEEHARRMMSEYADFGEALPKRQKFRPNRSHKDW